MGQLGGFLHNINIWDHFWPKFGVFTPWSFPLELPPGKEVFARRDPELLPGGTGTGGSRTTDTGKGFYLLIYKLVDKLSGAAPKRKPQKLL